MVPRAEPELHGIFVTGYEIPMRVEDCLTCHAGSLAGEPPFPPPPCRRLRQNWRELRFSAMR